MSYTIVGVIGHIDHGKTSLVAALTGVDTDTHPEEKRRGITIDLGFAAYTDGEHRFALIDAPGHQKYIGNLLAGVSAVDLGLLVVACDQGIQAQTLEHAAILQSLGVSSLIVAISRIDLADDRARDELSEELDVFLADFGFHNIPKVATSTVSGAGLDALKSLLREHARTADRAVANVFRLPIDRVFTVEGRGCVVAGTIWSGQVAVGDHLRLLPSSQTARVRELEAHGEPVSESLPGRRTALNLAGISAADIVRGDELVAPPSVDGGGHRTTTRLVAQLTMFRDAAEIRCPCTVQLHTATTSCAARITGTKRIGPGETSVVIVDTESPIVATYQQQCLFRKPYPVGSFAGARVLACVDPVAGQTKPLLRLGQQLMLSDAAGRLAAWVEYRGELQIIPTWLQLQLGIAADDIDRVVQTCLATDSIDMPRQGCLVSREAIARSRRYVLKLMTHQAEATDDAWLVEDAIVGRARSTGSDEVIRHAMDALVREKSLIRVNRMIAVASEKTVLSKKQRGRMEQILAMFGQSRTPPTLKEAAAKLDTTADNVASLIRFATQQRILIELGNGFFLSHQTFGILCRELNELFAENPQQSVASIRDQWQMTRKHAIPILEYCDQVGVTIREGDARTAGPELNKMLNSDSSERDPVEGQTIE